MSEIDAEVDDYFECLMAEDLGLLGRRSRGLWRRAASLCQSPIEQRMLAALSFMWLGAAYRLEHERVIVFGKEKPDDDLAGGWGTGVFLNLQAPVLTYRVDFLLRVRFEDTIHKIVIECDGHDFHERTKEQARHDRSRDRAMTAAGFTVFRFTGSEIYRDAEKCVEEVAKFIGSLNDANDASKAA